MSYYSREGVIRRLKEYYYEFQCVFGKEHVREMIDFIDSLPLTKYKDDICYGCMCKTEQYIPLLQVFPLEIKSLRKNNLDKYRRASFLHRIRIKIARRELYDRFTLFYEDESHYHIQISIDNLTSKYRKYEKKAQFKQWINHSLQYLYAKLPKDIIDYVIKPYLL